MMTNWYVKDLSKLTGVSVQTLHHYDHIGLVKPSARAVNGYRVYSQKDLLKLQQIIALKFFGFELARIKTLLTDEVPTRDHFAAQAKFLAEKARNYAAASKALQDIVSDVSDEQSIPWETIIKLIEVYKMTQELEESWASAVFTPEELNQYAQFRTELKNRFTLKDKEQFSKDWQIIVAEVRANITTNPRTPFGANIAKQAMMMINSLYGKEHANLRHTIWNNGFKKGKIDDERALAPDIVHWLDQATDYYYRERIYDLLDQVELGETPEVLRKWNDLMTEMFGDSEEMKQACYKAGAGPNDERVVGPNAKKWLQQLMK